MMNDNNPSLSAHESAVNENSGNGNESVLQAAPEKSLPMHLNGLSKKQPPHLRAQKMLKVQSPSDVLSPFSQKIMAERNSALKSLKPKSLTETLMNLRQSRLSHESEDSGAEELSTGSATNSNGSAMASNGIATSASTPSTPKPFQEDKVNVNVNETDF